jgi:hypothetical protein
MGYIYIQLHPLSAITFSQDQVKNSANGRFYQQFNQLQQHEDSKATSQAFNTGSCSKARPSANTSVIQATKHITKSIIGASSFHKDDSRLHSIHYRIQWLQV